MAPALARLESELFTTYLQQPTMTAYQNILVPIDGSQTSMKGLAEAIKIATLSKGRLRLVHVVDELSLVSGMGAYAAPLGEWIDALREAGQKLVEEACATVKAAGIEVDARVHDNIGAPVSDVVLEEAKGWGADLIVIGTHGRRGVRRVVLGSSAESIVRLSPVPVLLVRLPEVE